MYAAVMRDSAATAEAIAVSVIPASGRAWSASWRTSTGAPRPNLTKNVGVHRAGLILDVTPKARKKAAGTPIRRLAGVISPRPLDRSVTSVDNSAAGKGSRNCADDEH
jgi:hypothetical protein